jgi:hypothetical protein
MTLGRKKKMRKLSRVFLAAAFLAALALTAAAQQGQQDKNSGTTDQTFAIGQKIMGYDVAPGCGQDSRPASENPDTSNLGPTGTGLGIYKGMVFGEFDKVANGEEFACDFGSVGVWVCNSLSASGWHQLSGANPDMIIAGHFKNAAYDEIIGDFGALGLWMWEPGVATAFPGIWTQLSGVNASWEFAADDDYDTYQELFANFGAIGIWHYDVTNGWKIVSSLQPYHGLRMDSILFGYEEGCFCFPSVGVWRIYNAGGSMQQLTGTVTSEDDHASAKFTNGSAEDLVMDFATLGIWLLTDQSLTDWHQISSDNPDRLTVAHLGTDNPGLIIKDNFKSGLWYWHYAGSFPGSEVQINATSPDWYGFVEPFEYNSGDSDDELAVDMGANGLYVYEYYGGIWTQISAQNPIQMVAGNWSNHGVNDCLLVNFGGVGLWLFYAPTKTWYLASSVSPDNSSY